MRRVRVHSTKGFRKSHTDGCTTGTDCPPSDCSCGDCGNRIWWTRPHRDAIAGKHTSIWSVFEVHFWPPMGSQASTYSEELGTLNAGQHKGNVDRHDHPRASRFHSDAGGSASCRFHWNPNTGLAAGRPGAYCTAPPSWIWWARRSNLRGGGSSRLLVLNDRLIQGALPI